jgi:hypothetical protein
LGGIVDERCLGRTRFHFPSKVQKPSVA